MRRSQGATEVILPLDFPRIVGVVMEGEWVRVVEKELARGNVVVVLKDGRANGITDQIIGPK